MFGQKHNLGQIFDMRLRFETSAVAPIVCVWVSVLALVGEFPVLCVCVCVCVCVCPCVRVKHENRMY